EIDWDNKFIALESKAIDCIWNGMTISEEVLKNTSCSVAYVKNAQVVVMAEDKIASINKVVEVKEEKVEETQEVAEVQEEVVELIEEETPIIEESILPSFDVVEEFVEEEKKEEMDLEFICKILLHASKDEKINDMIIYNRLEMYHYEPDKRKFYNALQGTELFASCRDAIVICVDNLVQYSKINDPILNEEIYNFLNDEFGIDKMVYAIDQEMCSEVVKLFKQNRNNPEMNDLRIEKYERKKGPKSKEDELIDLVGDIVEDTG
ncbi:MAG: transporter substrate-binding domain-containing protein, partial [Parabacteroides sp.]|nr:transporter substrate-binding domain-containing protein [Parabacteroides sp.]